MASGGRPAGRIGMRGAPRRSRAHLAHFHRPWQVHLCAVRADDPTVRPPCADQLYEALQKHGMEVIFDDRNVSAGVMFSDADLLGVPVRIIVSPRNLKENCCEITTRDKSFCQKTPLSDAVAHVSLLVEKFWHNPGKHRKNNNSPSSLKRETLSRKTVGPFAPKLKPHNSY